MAHTLISFLGAPSGPDPRVYRPASYDFGGGAIEPTPFFALALLRHLRATASARPDRLVVLGTSGSMWDTLVYANATPAGEAEEAAWVALSEAVTANRATQPMLDDYSMRLSAALEIDCELVLIPYARDEEEQIGVLRTLRETLRPHELVTLDLTHGLRHLPILGMMSALLLEATREATIGKIYYGALELTPRLPGSQAGPRQAAAISTAPPPEPEPTPVLLLTGLIRVGRWLAAMSIFDRGGDYGVFAPLLLEEGASERTVRFLKSAAFLEQTNRVDLAREELRKFRDRLAREAPGLTMIQLFRPLLDKRFEWAETGDAYARLRGLAQSSLADGDYMRAAVRGFEAFLRRLRQPPPEWMAADEARPNQSGKRPLPNPEKRFYEQTLQSRITPGRPTIAQKATFETYRDLRETRNALVHGEETHRQAAKAALESQENCATALARWFAALLPSGAADGDLDY